MMRQAFFLFLMSVAIAFPAAAQVQKDAMYWLQRVATAAEKLNYSGTFVYQSGNRTETSRIAHRVDGGREVERIETLDGSPRELIRDDNEVKCFLPEDRLLIIERRSPRPCRSPPPSTALMGPARERLAPVLEALPIRDPAVPLVRNVDARVVRDAASCREGLVRQVAGAVLWQESVKLLLREGVTTFVEVGPGTVLGGLVKRISRGARVLNVDSPRSLEAAVAALVAGVEG